MFKKVLICEDFESYSLSIEKTLGELNITNIEQVHYCDDAYFKIKTALASKQPYDLLILDLIFNEGDKPEELKSGEELISKLREENIDIKIVIFSIENRKIKIDYFFRKYKINAFVTKGREDIRDFKKALKEIQTGKCYISEDQKLVFGNVYDLTDYDQELLRLLSTGSTTTEVADKLKKKGIEPNSESFIKKRLMFIRIMFNAVNTKQLLLVCKDRGIV